MTAVYPHWQCQTHGVFDARIAVGCPDCVRDQRVSIARLTEEASFWATVADGVSHDPRCRNHLQVAPQTEGWLCLRCERDRLSDGLRDVKTDKNQHIVELVQKLSGVQALMVPLRRCLTFTCACGDDFDSVEHFAEHVAAVHPDDAVCAHCGTKDWDRDGTGRCYWCQT